MELSKIKREGERLIKYKMNLTDNKHLFLYKVGELFYSFILKEGVLVNENDREITNTNLKGNKKLGKHAREYFRSSLNEWQTDNQINQINKT